MVAYEAVAELVDEHVAWCRHRYRHMAKTGRHQHGQECRGAVAGIASRTCRATMERICAASKPCSNATSVSRKHKT